MVKSIYQNVEISRVVFDKRYYPRNDYSWQTAYDYSESMKTGVKFPRIVLAKLGNNLILVDGKHRLEANKNCKKKSIEAEILIGLPEDRIYVEAVKRNIAHGRQLSIQEKLQVAVKLKDLHYSQEQICKLVQIPAGKLKNLIGRKLISSITGNEIILKKEFEDISKSPYSDTAQLDIDLLQQDFTGQNQLNLIRELNVLIIKKAINLKDKKIVIELSKLKALLSKVKLKIK